ncbi:MAG: DUF975 family protein [Clostridiales bacterium]|nr:DUF975 family protein [Clostridiales bacterium]
MVAKDIKGEARRKLALNMHQAIIVYTVEFTIFITLIALVAISFVSLGKAFSDVAAYVMIAYGSLLLIIAIVGAGMISFAMTDFYLMSYRCQPYNIRRLGETIARSNITKVLLVSLRRTLMSLLLLLCLIVPGVIYLLRTSMASYLLIANPKMKPSDSLKASGKVMSGKTGTYFSLCMSLLGWYILGIITLGLGFIFIAPYLNMVKTEFYKRNLQGDKQAYTVSPQALASMPQQQYMQQGMPQQSMPQQQYMQQGMPQQGMPQQQVVQQPSGPAPIDALGQDDVMDMNAAIQDFGGDVPEVPLAAPTGMREEKPGKIKMTREEKKLAKEAAKQRKGDGIVETERTLSTQEIAHMSNPAGQGGKINYFDSNGASSIPADFDDDFGVTPITADEAVVVEGEAQAIDAEQVISDSEFDELMRNFDAGTQAASDDEFAPEVLQDEFAPEVIPMEEESAPEVKADEFAPEVISMDEPIDNAQNADNNSAPSEPAAPLTAAERRKAAEERIARDRQAAADRLAGNAARPRTTDLSERAERLRREREERLKNQNPKK